jgi:hypothetical protein
MPVKPDSRYANLPLEAVTAPDGSRRNVIGLRLTGQDTNVPATLYRVRRSEAPDFLARRFLGDEHLWWRILDANPVIYPLDLQAGDALQIPSPGPATAITRARSF